MMDDKQRAAMEAANPGEKLGYRILWDKGAEWMHAHDAEKLALVEVLILIREYHKHPEERASHRLVQYSQAMEKADELIATIGKRIIAEAKENTNGR